ncbi:hypothetical protein L7F22_062113 [Adiantum nelumboides]|nr:hypothetical protein [Adiantum nelumboides]
MGIALGMALHYMPSKQHYWKDEMVGSLVFPNFGEKMSQTTFQQIKRFLHLRDNAQRPPRGSREHKLWQLVELEEWLNYTFQKHYNVGKCVTVDERIIPSKSKLNPCQARNIGSSEGDINIPEATKNMRICYASQNLSVMGYTDSDYAGDLDNKRSTSGYVFTMAGGAVSWQCRLQTCVTQSTTYAEYVVASEALKEANWHGWLVIDLGIKEEMPMSHCDSQSAIQLARNPVYHSNKKHVDVKYHFIKEMSQDK